MREPGPDHPITIVRNERRAVVTFAGRTIADSRKALVLREASLPPVLYFPRADVYMAALTRTEHTTHCPFKGDAAYYSVGIDGGLAENAVWTYEQPYPAVSAIGDHLAFYASKMDAITEVD